MTSDGEVQPVVVVGVDGSPESVAALTWAGRYAAATGATVRAVYAWHVPAMAGMPAAGKAPEPVTAEIEERIRADVTEAIAKAFPDPSTAKIETKIAHGHPAEVLIDESEHASLLVVGHRGHGAFTGMLVGSVSIHCVTHAACPVVVVRGS
ncbi:MAG TPA: universal stress protein [Streptosporangiaceae bacterium]|nr:universal stress protein [Streptosporangiaceae bacterium]